MSLQKQLFLLSYLKTLSVGPAGVRTRDLPLSRLALSQLSQCYFGPFHYFLVFCQEQLSYGACIRQGSSNRNLKVWQGGRGGGRLLDKRLLFEWGVYASIRSFIVYNNILAAHCTFCAFRFIWQAFIMEGDVSGVRTPQNRTEIRINTAQNNIRKSQTALKLPKKFLNTANYLVL